MNFTLIYASLLVIFFILLVIMTIMMFSSKSKSVDYDEDDEMPDEVYVDEDWPGASRSKKRMKASDDADGEEVQSKSAGAKKHEMSSDKDDEVEQVLAEVPKLLAEIENGWAGLYGKTSNAVPVKQGEAEGADGEYTEEEYADSAFGETESTDGEYTEEEYVDSTFGDAESTDGEYTEEEYADSAFGETEGADGEYAEEEYADGELGEYADSTFGDAESADGEYTEEEYADSAFGETESTDGEYAEAEYADSELGEYADSTFGDAESADGEYAEEEYADSELGEYADSTFGETESAAIEEELTDEGEATGEMDEAQEDMSEAAAGTNAGYVYEPQRSAFVSAVNGAFAAEEMTDDVSGEAALETYTQAAEIAENDEQVEAQTETQTEDVVSFAENSIFAEADRALAEEMAGTVDSAFGEETDSVFGEEADSAFGEETDSAFGEEADSAFADSAFSEQPVDDNVAAYGNASNMMPIDSAWMSDAKYDARDSVFDEALDAVPYSVEQSDADDDYDEPLFGRASQKNKRSRVKGTEVKLARENYWYNKIDMEEKASYMKPEAYYRWFEAPSDCISDMLIELYDSGLVRTEEIKYIAYGIVPRVMTMTEIMNTGVDDYLMEKVKEPTEEELDKVYEKWCSYVDTFLETVVEINADEMTKKSIMKQLYDFGNNSPDVIIRGV